jgi:dUTPase
MWTTENQTEIRAALERVEAAARGLRLVVIGAGMDMPVSYGAEVIAGSYNELRAALASLDAVEFEDGDARDAAE